MLLDELQEPEPVLLDGLLEHVAELLGPVPVLLGLARCVPRLNDLDVAGSDVGSDVGSDAAVERSGEGVGDAFADLGVSPPKPPFNLRMVPPAK